MKFLKTSVMLAAAGLLSIGTAQAATTLYSTPSLMDAYSGSNGSVDAVFSSPGAGLGNLSFQLGGTNSLDGVNSYTDYFTLSVNGTPTLQGSFNLGGGGSNQIYFSPFGTTALVTTFGATDDIHNSGQVTWQGGIADISLPITLRSGSNTLRFAYGDNLQGIGDEGWKVNAVTVTTAVPEPETYSMLMVGLGLLGFISRRKKAAK